MKILIVEDQDGFRARLVQTLRAEGHDVTAFPSGEESLAFLTREPVDIIILDIGLPGINGLQVLEKLRGTGVDAPVLILTGQTSEESVVQGLTTGADDYISKPFSNKELLARIGAAHRRARWAAGILRAVGPLELDMEVRTVSMKGQVIDLTDKEFALLWTLSQELIRPWSREEIIDKIWKMDLDSGAKAMGVHLSNLRKKLRVLEGVEIRFVPREGYLLEVPFD